LGAMQSFGQGLLCPSSREIFGNDSKQHMARKLRAVNTQQ
jgi:hypothetical protein